MENIAAEQSDIIQNWRKSFLVIHSTEVNIQNKSLLNFNSQSKAKKKKKKSSQ